MTRRTMGLAPDGTGKLVTGIGDAVEEARP